MSYFGRIGARAAGVPAVGLAPAGPLSSPFARIDQRLNLFAQWGASFERVRSSEAGSDLEQDDAGPTIENTLEPSGARTPHRTVDRPHDVPVPAAALAGSPQSRAVAATTLPESGAAPRPPAPSERVVFEPTPAASPRDVETTAHAAAVQAASPAAGPRDAAQPARDVHVARVRPPESVESSAQRSTPSAALPARPRTDAEATGSVRSPVPGSAPNEPMAKTLEQALGRVDAWMRNERRREAAPVEQVPRALERAAKLAPVAVAAAATPSRVPSAIAPRADEGSPRLAIGSIEVRVIPPAPAPIAAPRVERLHRNAGGAVVSSAATRAPAHLTFGLRQR